MLPTRCISPPCENMLVNSVAVEGTRASSLTNSASPKNTDGMKPKLSA